MPTIESRLAKLKRTLLIEKQIEMRNDLFNHDYLSEVCAQNYHIQVDSPEAFRQAIIEWCALAAYKLRDIKTHIKHSEQKKIEQEIRSYEMMAKFWNNVRINGR